MKTFASVCALAVLFAAVLAPVSEAVTAAEFTALENIYNSLGGANWDSQWGWCQYFRNTQCPLSGTRSQFDDPCDTSFSSTFERSLVWDGIVCEANRVIAVNLGYNSLTSTTGLPDISGLVRLERLFLQANTLSGGIANAGWSSLTSLRTVHLYDNGFSGTLPASLLNIPALENLLIFNNAFSGNLPGSTLLSPNLVTFRFNNNQFNGPIPSSYNRLTDLEGFYGQGNALTGSIPDVFDSISGLKFVDLSGNQLIGPLPNSLDGGNQPSVNLENNQLDCNIPSGIEHQLKLGGNTGFTCEFPPIGPNVENPGTCVPLRVLTVSPGVFSAESTTPIDVTLTGSNFDNCLGRYHVAIDGPVSVDIPFDDLTVTGKTRITFSVPAGVLDQSGTYTINVEGDNGVILSSSSVAFSAIIECDPLCDPKTNPNVGGCNNENGECSCKARWTPPTPTDGKICFQSQCRDPSCNGRGTCNLNSGECDCETGWTGEDCGAKDLDCKVNDCHGNGFCNRQVEDTENNPGFGSCYCNIGYDGATICEECIAGFIPHQINGTNVCVQPVDCAATCVDPRGVCNQATGTCECESGFAGPNCEDYGCDGVNNCSNRGKCVDSNVCECNVGFEGEDCSQKVSSTGGIVAGAIAGGAAVLLLSAGSLYLLRKRAIARIKRERGMEMK